MRTLAVVGTAGGVGTTTVAAMAFAGLRDHPQGAPMLYARPSARLLERVGGDEVAAISGEVAIWDAGVHAPESAAALLEAGGCVLAVAAPATPMGVSDAARVLACVSELGEEALAGVTVVLSQVNGAGAMPSTAAVPSSLLVRIGYDRGLAGPAAIRPVVGRRARAGARAWQRRAAALLAATP